ncbi:uncharacterized protein LOC128556764 [Mercenaria mercenaria]|uniref:uncharacterized protein LOC128556764 n=1 Tax=Mercenaria mercenaria TaxID=6596 RepID=UPI00234E8B96|nr:uncharacterized protein LOC128556764 [Mercenaria mercenaria]
MILQKGLKVLREIRRLRQKCLKFMLIIDMCDRSMESDLQTSSLESLRNGRLLKSLDRSRLKTHLKFTLMENCYTQSLKRKCFHPTDRYSLLYIIPYTALTPRRQRAAQLASVFFCSRNRNIIA